MARDAARIAVVPAAFCPTATTAHAALLVFDLERQVARRALAAAGRPAAGIDRPAAIRRQLMDTAARVLGSEQDWARCLGLVREAEIDLLSAAVGWPIRDPAAIEALLPAWLRGR